MCLSLGMILRIMNKENLILIIARGGGTKNVSKQNLRLVNGKPLLYYVLNTAKSCTNCHTVVSTDSDEIAEYVKFFGGSVIKRSKACSTQHASTEMVIEEFLRKYTCDYVVLIQATNLFVKTEHLDKAIKKIINNSKKYDTLLSVVSNRYLIWKKKKNNCIFPINYNYKKRLRSQDAQTDEYVENGSFYIFKTRGFFKNKNRLFGKITYFEMPKESIFEVDDKEDLMITKKLITK